MAAATMELKMLVLDESLKLDPLFQNSVFSTWLEIICGPEIPAEDATRLPTVWTQRLWPPCHQGGPLRGETCSTICPTHLWRLYSRYDLASKRHEYIGCQYICLPILTQFYTRKSVDLSCKTKYLALLKINRCTEKPHKTSQRANKYKPQRECGKIKN